MMGPGPYTVVQGAGEVKVGKWASGDKNQATGEATRVSLQRGTGEKLMWNPCLCGQAPRGEPGAPVHGRRRPGCMRHKGRRGLGGACRRGGSCLSPPLTTVALLEKRRLFPFHLQKSHTSCSFGQF